MPPSAEAIDNQGLFSDYYLENVFGDRPDIEDLFGLADEALERARALYDREKQSLQGTKEGQTENRFIRPLLDEVLGWDFIVQETVQGQTSFGEPDYALFSNPEPYRTASEEASNGQRDRVFRRATALAEAKKWQRSLDGTEAPATAGGAPSQGTPGAQLLRYFQWTQVPWGLLTNGNRWRLYTSRVPSPVDTYLEFDLEHILEQPHGTAEDPTDARTAFRLFYTLFRADAFREDPTLGRPFIESVFEESVEQGEALEDELTERVFDEVFLKLATGLYEDARDEADAEVPSEAVLDEIYEATLRLLYRLLFLLYAEERDLLPVRDQKGYYQYSLTRIAREAREEVHNDYVLVGDDLWEDLQRLFDIINTGEADLNVPTYNGHLFDVGAGDNAWLDRHTVPDEHLAPALTALTLMDPDDPDSRGVDYKALDVRQLGSIYEGLLEHRLRYAAEDRAVVRENGTEVYKLLSDVENPVEVVAKGDLYLETDQSERKKTGSYYTPHYVVEYIVENTLGPILDERIEAFEDAMADVHAILADHDPDDHGVEAKLDAPRRRAREALLDLRVCDPAMGSGHFLVHAVDYLTNRIGAAALERDWAVNPIREALDDIRGDVLDSLDEQDVQLDNAEARLDDFTLLKRLVMKRCIYGVDRNPMAVELAKLSLWLRSFTVGAPLSFLDHHLKPGNSLIGTRVDDVRAALEAEGQQFEVFGGPFAGLLQATELMQTVARLSDATVEEVRESAERFAEYEEAMDPYKRILDLWVSRHFGNERADYLLRQFGTQVLDVFRGQADPSDEEQRAALERAVALSDAKKFFHWELEFPEVYYDLDRSTRKQTPGFDAVIGNPPYVRIQTLSETDEQAVEFFNDTFEGPSGNYDIYALFAEKGGTLINEDGTLGYILPHKFFTANYGKGLRTWISDRNALRHVVDFESEQVFDHATTYTCLLFLDGSSRSEFSYIHPPSPEAITGNGTLQTYTLQTDALDERPWSFGNPKLLELRSRFDEAHPSLEDVTSRIFQGLKTSADDIYIVEELEREDEDVRVYSPELDDEVWVEPDLFHPLIKGGDVEAYHIADTDRLILFPYGPDENGEMDLLPADTLENQYPLTWEYLERNRDLLEDRESGGFKDERWYRFGRTQALDVVSQSAIVTPDFADVASYAYDESGEHYFTGGAAGGYGILVDEPLSPWYALALLNSRLLDRILKTVSSTFRGGWYSYESRFIKHLPIREIDVTTPEDEREHHRKEIVGTYEADREAAVDPADSATLARVDDHLAADPERADVVHDLLAHLARAMTQLKAERATYNLDVTDWIDAPASDGGITLRDIGRYQPAEGVTGSLLADTTDERDHLRIGRLTAEREEAGDTHTVHVRATARFKPCPELDSGPKGERDTWPAVVPDDAEPDQWGYVETDPLPVCTLHDCSELDAGLLVHWLAALNGADSGFSGYRDTAAKTISLLDRLYDLRFPDPSENGVADALRPFLDNAQQAAELDRQIAFTDELIDRIVYRLYGLTDEEVGVVEGNT